MQKGQINPPNAPLVSQNGSITNEWYRYFVQRKVITDAITDAAILTIGTTNQAFPNGRVLAVAPGELTATESDTDYTLGLADTAVTPGAYGDASHVIAVTVDAKGRIIDAQAFPLNSDNVTEGATNLFFTQARARASVSGSDGISYTVGTGNFVLDQSFTRGLFSGGSHINYNSGTGAIAFTGTGVTGTFTPPLSITVVDGLITAIS